MSSVDELLFAPIDGSDEPWRAETRKLVQFIRQMREQRRKRPAGSLFLEDLMEDYHIRGQTLFWAVNSTDGCWPYEFKGLVFVDDEGYASLNDPNGNSIVGLNLFPSDTGDLYMFAEQSLAEKYEEQLMED